MLFWRGSVVVFLATVVLLCGRAAPASAATGASQVPWAGVMVDGPVIAPTGTDYDDQWPAIRAAHLGFVRLAFYWPQLEPVKGTFDFTSTDALVAKAVGQGLEVLPVVLRTPGWAAVNRRSAGSPPKRPEDFGPLMQALIGRYGPTGTFWTDNPQLERLTIRSWQVWNEPDLKPYWNARNWAAGYVRLLKAGHAAIKRADPGATVVLGGLTNQSWADLALVYRAGGRRYFDAAALHIYTKDAQGVGIVAGKARKVMRANGDRRKPIWLTEVTWPSSRGKRRLAPVETTERGQAQRVKTGIPELARLRPKLGIDKVVWYSWLTVEDHVTWQTYSGLLRLRKHKVVRTPAYTDFVRALRRLAD